MLTLRAANPTDYDLFALLFGELETGDFVLDRARWTSETMPHTLIAEADGRGVGYAYFECLRGLTYVRQLAVAKAARRNGVGNSLMAAMAQRSREVGICEWVLNVKPENVAALRLYERHGMRMEYAATSLRIPWSRALVLPGAGAEVREIPEAEERAVEAAMHLLPGVCASTRDKPGRVLAQARIGRAIVGAAMFDPLFPGAFPFRVAQPEVAGDVLRYLHAFAERDFMQLVVENDAPLRASLLKAGAEVRLDMLRYRGQIPPAALA